MKKQLCSCMLVVSAFCLPAMAQVDFTVLAGEGSVLTGFVGPSGRHGAAGATVGDNPYVFGGCNVQGRCFNDLYMFRPTTNSWSSLSDRGDTPSPRAGASLVLFRNYLVLFGGTNNDGTYNDVYRYDLSSGRWSYGLSPGNLRPQSRSGHAAATDGEKIYILGGYNENGKFLDDMWIIDLAAEAEHIGDNQFAVAFHLVKPENGSPRGRELATLTYVDKKLFLFGGYGSLGLTASDIWVYNIESNAWEQPRTSGSEPAPREGHSAVRNGHNIVIAGGCDVTRDVQRCYNDVWKLDTGRMLWTLLSASHPQFGARELHTAHMISGGRILIIGGQKMSARDYQDVVMFETESCGGTPACSGNGACINGSCSCSSSWMSHDCGEKDGCPLGCRGHGFCLSGVCHCLPGFRGETCYRGKLCPGTGFKGDCNGNGTCNNDGMCECKPGFRGSGCENATEQSQSVIKQQAAAHATEPTERFGWSGTKTGSIGVPVSGLSMLATNLVDMRELPPVQHTISVSSGGVPDLINALESDIPGMPRTDIPIPEVKIQPPHTHLPTADIRSPLPTPPSQGETVNYLSLVMRVVVGAISLVGSGATVSVMYAINQKRK